MDQDDDVQLQSSPTSTQQHSKKKHKTKRIREQEEKLEVKIETVSSISDKSLPIIGYFPSGYDPDKRKRTEEPRVRLLKHVKRSNRLQLVVSPNQSSQVNFVGTNYSGEAAAPQVCSYALGVFDKQTQTLKIVQIEANKIFRLEPRFGDEDNVIDETSKVMDNEATVEDTQAKYNFSTKKSERTAKREKAQRAYRDPEAQEDLNNKMVDAKVNTTALETSVATTSSARNIPPHDISATSPEQAYPLEKIILKGEWRYLYDISELLQQGRNITPESYPLFVCNRTHKLEEVKGETSEVLACIFSYINHLIKFKDKHSLDGLSSAKNHKLPSILTQKFNDMFGNADSKRLANDKLLISYVLVLTLIVDKFKTEFSDIAKDLRMSTGELRPHFEFLGCKFIRENNITLATLPAPLKFPEVRMKRRK
ncbi:DNA-directed RNA polymerase I subunit rpa49 [Rutidosis leptorrhynchoides]|uniref:DNA-directed RNA polymerase I subunit rpa49 n=1 Tax=Rutidosis leptorrhynchoides TaxID=125765 RepID=UPI003A99FA9A